MTNVLRFSQLFKKIISRKDMQNEEDTREIWIWSILVTFTKEILSEKLHFCAVDKLCHVAGSYVR